MYAGYGAPPYAGSQGRHLNQNDDVINMAPDTVEADLREET